MNIDLNLNLNTTLDVDLDRHVIFVSIATIPSSSSMPLTYACSAMSFITRIVSRAAAALHGGTPCVRVETRLIDRGPPSCTFRDVSRL